MDSQITLQSIKDRNYIPFDEKPIFSSGEKPLWIWWLGQAGFLINFGNTALLIDPYLSDFLAQKYKGTEFPHIRMMPAPIKPEEILNLDFVFCTHAHSDHMDPGSLPLLAQNNPKCKFIVPKAEKSTAADRGIPPGQMICVNAGESLKLGNDIHLDIIPSAHEDLKMNEHGAHFYLGYIITFAQYKLYHSGDCLPYPGLSDNLKNFGIDLALLPVNGRDKNLKEKGVPGNFTFNEAVSLCIKCKIPNLIVHHFGMFSFNTVNVETLRQKYRKISDNLNLIVPETHFRYEIKNIK